MPQGTGVATYARGVASCLPLAGMETELLVARPARSRPLRWMAAAWPGAARARPEPQPSPEGWHVRTAPDVFRIAQVHFDIWGKLRQIAGPRPPDVMHWTYPLPLRLRGRPNIYTVHDLIPLLHPGLTPIDPARMRRLLLQVALHADHLVTVSEAARQDVIATLGVPPDRVTNTWQTVDVTALSSIPAGGVPGLQPGSYWMHAGTVEPRKNLPRVIEAWWRSGTRYPLVLAGPDGWDAAGQLAGAEPFLSPEPTPGRPSVLRLPWLDRPALLALIRDARALLMPSLAEGFGLPVAEAMALGTPVLTASLGALAEVAGDAAITIDPNDGAAIADAMRALDAAPDLRAALVLKGKTRALLFGPAPYADRLKQLYETVLDRHA